ncbi:peptidoglycan editing factor PgeF [Paenibacillus sp. FJAT-26967]|uniref:peptidoglycan editing factor PgeF n=1 Tax=Paenibacillus sp. FJAT-26967 TaxID=1729690 RepID=UPI000838D456|nr:peptidoglycan editing factor PgeF [Paenibacillus sp. FJAT-26967]
MEPFVRTRTNAGEPELFVLSGLQERFPFLQAGFTSRHGGVSSAPFDSLNMGLHVNDGEDDVIDNRKKLAEALNVPFGALTFGEQVHGKDVAVVSAEMKGKGRLSRADALQDTDAFVTADKGVMLCALFADCVPIYLIDPVNRVVGLAHAGWKGTVLNIGAATLASMSRSFGSRPDEVYAAIGPSIGACCYEVDDTVADRVYKAHEEIGAPQEDTDRVVMPQNKGKYQLNLQECNRQFLEKAGILSSRIEVTKLCTSCATDSFYSHRKEKGLTGRMAAWIGLREE